MTLEVEVTNKGGAPRALYISDPQGNVAHSLKPGESATVHIHDGNGVHLAEGAHLDEPKAEDPPQVEPSDPAGDYHRRQQAAEQRERETLTVGDVGALDAKAD